MSESSQLVRQWKLLLALESSHTGCTIQDLIVQLEMADKTIRRDLKVLKTVFRITEPTGDIDSVDVQNLRYEVPRDLSLRDWLANSFGV